MKKFVIFIASMSLVLSPLVFAQKQTGGGGSRNSGGNATNVLFTPTQFRTNGIGQIQIKPAATQTNGAFWSDGTTFSLKAVGPVDGSQDAFRQFESTTDGSTGYKLYGNASMKWALNSDGSGSGTGLLTVGSLATTGAAGTLWVTNSSVVVTNTTTHDNIVLNTNGTITINGSAIGSSGLGYTLPFSVATGGNPLDSTKYYLGFSSYGNTPFGDTTTTYTIVKVPKAGRIKAIWLSIRIAGTLGSSENVSIYATNLTQNVGTSAITSQWNDVVVFPSGTFASDCAVAAADSITIVFDTPAWATNPTTVCPGGWLYIE